ncbi:MAG: hypothetical protein M1834_007980 [Cirrosporium novae-zelandiae]|nr:MAG: hypothetical protein M1834_007980 [Cirrosporium novae-zelandiae]
MADENESNLLIPKEHDDSSPKSFSKSFKVFAFCTLVLVTWDIGAFLTNTPRLRLYESNVCREYYSVHDPSYLDDHGNVLEKYCKIDAVQHDVAILFGWQALFDYIPGMNINSFQLA